jgi:hypothetical protein
MTLCILGGLVAAWLATGLLLIYEASAGHWPGCPRN